MNRLLATSVPIVVLIASPALADPMYGFTDLGAVSSGHAVQYGTDSNGQGYVTNTDGVIVSPFVRSTQTLSDGAPLDPFLVQQFPAGTVFHPQFLTSQGVVVGSANVPAAVGYIEGVAEFYYRSSDHSLVTIYDNLAPNPIANADINSSGTIVGNRETTFFDGRPADGLNWGHGVMTLGYAPALYSPFKSIYDPTKVIDLSTVVNQPGWQLNQPGLPMDSLARIDDLGRIVAYGDDNGVLHAFLLTPSSLAPSPMPVPEPTSLAVFGLLSISLLAPSASRRMRIGFARARR